MPRLLLFPVALCCLAVCGCHDGPLYALKHANPYFVREWKKDEALGITDFQRRKELELLVRTLPSMSANEQAEYMVHLQQILDKDPSPDMRHLAVRASTSISGPAALSLAQQALDDDSLKVRMAACDVLGKRPEPEAAQSLAKLVGESSNLDIRQAALRALGGHRGDVVKDSLKLALDDRDPAIRMAAMQSLEQVTGEPLGTSDPDVWVAYLEGKPYESNPGSFAERMRSMF
ncbi:HEAT repeat protein [Roseimaritima ulvae]|uniref:HEAT repeat protein n=2 Tax=Roseimaritima ulvae TaxID=980254 RepID=A0A5B9R735_9BACT|nr:HEAT repeat protein [Roseimaritima ulvae]